MVKLIKFALVGGSGTLVNLSLFYSLVDRGGMSPTIGAVLCFLLAVTLNYFFDHLWTFRDQIAGEPPSAARYLRFVGVSSVGLLANLSVLNLVILTVHPSYKVLGQAAGIACGMIATFTGSNLFAFRPRFRKITSGPTCPHESPIQQTASGRGRR